MAVSHVSDLVDHEEFATMFVGGLMFGIQVSVIQDILAETCIVPVPLTPDDIRGVINLRGRVVTAIDLRRRLQMPLENDQSTFMSTVVEFESEYYSLLVDKVGEVVTLPINGLERNPPTLQMEIAKFSKGIYRLQDKLLVILDIKKILTFSES